MPRGSGKKPKREVTATEFKAKCLSLLDQVSKTKTSLRITRRGKAVVDVVPVSPEVEEKGWFGSMSATMEITGDIVSPIIDTGPTDAEAEETR